jgi:hypothetical protein
LSAWYFFLSLSNAVEHFEQCPLLTLRGEGRWTALLIVVVLVEIFLGGFLCHLNKAFFGASAHLRLRRFAAVLGAACPLR